jgi:hypothetical protein
MKICDWESKGNVVRLYCCVDDKYDKIWGDDWNDVPYEHNAGRVYDEWIDYTVDLFFSWDVDILEPENDWRYQGNSPYCKEDFKNRVAPIFIAYYRDENEWPANDYYSRFMGADNSNKILKWYMGDNFEARVAGLSKNILPHWEFK